jgi:hypothetical protein
MERDQWWKFPVWERGWIIIETVRSCSVSESVSVSESTLRA